LPGHRACAANATKNVAASFAADAVASLGDLLLADASGYPARSASAIAQIFA
jgi:hypothetical protein